MKKMALTVLILLLLALTFPSIPSIPKVSATTTEDSRRVTALPDDVPCEPMPENYITEDYLDTTNPYSQVNPLGEETDEEGSHPLYVLVFGDEEERDVIRADPSNPVLWDGYARLQLERGDESLVANFGIDIRILGFLEWDSDDSIEYMTDLHEWDLCDELLADKGHYLRTWYDGEWWSNYVDAIIGITDQETPQTPTTYGVAPSLNELNQGTLFVLLKWKVYWQDDNLVQHEVSHLYYAPDHPGPQPPAPCCAMAYHTHFQTFIYEDLLWMVFGYVGCGMTSYYWCTSCSQTIQQNSGRYPLRTLTISASSGGTTYPAPGTYTYGYGESEIVTATADSHYYFDHWVLDGVGCGSDPTITVTMDSDHNLKAYFTFYNNAPDTPSLTGPTSGYVSWSYTYRACATDPDNDWVEYTFYWGDDSTPTTTDYYGSDVEVSRSHSWSSTGTYSVQVKATDVYGAYKYSSSLTVTISTPGGCPTLLVWNGSNYVDYGVIDIRDVENDVVREVHVQAEDVSVSGHKVKFTLGEGWEGLNYSHSLIDQVKLYAVDSEGNRYLCPLMKAEHSEQGKVLLNLLFSDDYRIDTYLMDTIDLTFKVPYPAGTIENFAFIIEGHNPWKM